MHNRRNSLLVTTIFLSAVITGVMIGLFVDQETAKKWRDQILKWLE